MRIGFSLLAALTSAGLAACSTSSRSYDNTGMTTSSLPPRPTEGMVREPARPYGDGYGLGRAYNPPATGALQGQYQWNGNPDRSQEGTAPLQPPAQVSAANDGRRSIVVRPGDTLYSISRQHGVTVSDLVAANRLTGETLHAGQSLVLPSTVR